MTSAFERIGDLVVDDEAILLDQLEFHQWCEILRSDGGECGRPAAWLGICLYCDHVVPFCGPHHDALLGLEGDPAVGTFHCHACLVKSKHLYDLMIFVPIGRTS